MFGYHYHGPHSTLSVSGVASENAALCQNFGYPIEGAGWDLSQGLGLSLSGQLVPVAFVR